MLVYLATPIDFVSREKNPLMFNQRESYVRLIQAMGHVVYSPSTAFAVAGKPDPSLQDLNWAALDRSDAILAVLPAGCFTVGVPMEIGYAKAQGIPVAVLTDNARSWALAGFERFTMEGLDGCRRALQYLESCRRPSLAPTPLFFTVEPGGSLPDRGYDDDAGLDLYTLSEPAELDPGETCVLRTGVAVELPRSHWALIHGRSSTLRRELRVETGVIDPGYRGELLVTVTNIGHEVQEIVGGTKIAQLILLPAANRFVPSKVEQLGSSQDGRGTNGFGSTTERTQNGATAE
jgi:dUTP pyrophosphatase